MSIYVQKCVLESVDMAKFSSPPAGPLAAGLESDFCRCRLEVLHLFQNFTRLRNVAVSFEESGASRATLAVALAVCLSSFRMK